MNNPMPTLTAESIANAILREAGSGLRHYTDYSQQKILAVSQLFVDQITLASQAAAIERDLLTTTIDECRRLREVNAALLAELKKIRDWALLENAPLRSQEIESIQSTIALAERTIT